MVHSGQPWDERLSTNIIFFTLILAQMLHVFNMASIKVAFHKSEVFTNQFVWYALGLCLVILFLAYRIAKVKEVLQLQSIQMADWGIILCSASASLFFSNLFKRIKIIE